METISPTTQDDSSGANPNSVESEDSSPQSTWSKVKAECPSCKQNFKSTIHNVRSNHQYEEYMVEQRETKETIDRFDIVSTIAQATATRSFRDRTMLTLPRWDPLGIKQPFLQQYLARVPPSEHCHSADFRRTVYCHNLYARPLPDFTGWFRDCSPEFYRYNDSQMDRLVPWLNRELDYLLNENEGHISYVITRILELLPQYHINSPEFRAAMQPYFRDRTEHFLHELYCFASTPYDLTGYDRYVRYTTDTRISTMVNEVISSSESDASEDSDIVTASSSEPAEPPPAPKLILKRHMTAADLQVAVTTVNRSDLAPEELGQIQASIEEKLMCYVLDPESLVVPVFGGKPVIADGVLKLTCLDKATKLWLEGVVSGLPAASNKQPLTVLSQKDLPKRIRCGIFLPARSGTLEQLHSMLHRMNPWAGVDKWALYSSQQQDAGIFIKVGVPDELIPVIQERNRCLAFSLGSVYLQLPTGGSDKDQVIDITESEEETTTAAQTQEDGPSDTANTPKPSSSRMANPTAESVAGLAATTGSVQCLDDPADEGISEAERRLARMDCGGSEGGGDEHSDLPSSDLDD